MSLSLKFCRSSRENHLWGEICESDVKIWKECLGNQLSQEMEQNDFTFLCTQRMSCRFKLTPSVNQMITFSKQSQYDDGSEQTTSCFRHSDYVAFIWMQIDWMCRYTFVRLTVCSMSAFLPNCFFSTLTLNLAALLFFVGKVNWLMPIWPLELTLQQQLCIGLLEKCFILFSINQHFLPSIHYFTLIVLQGSPEHTVVQV